MQQSPTGSPEASLGACLARSPPQGTQGKPREACASRDQLHEEPVTSLARHTPRENNSTRSSSKTLARPGPREGRRTSRGSAAPTEKLSPNRTSNISVSLLERHEFLAPILRFACTSRGSPRESLSRALTSSRGITPSSLVRAQVQHTSDGVLALGGWDPATQSAKNKGKKGWNLARKQEIEIQKRTNSIVITYGTTKH